MTPAKLIAQARNVALYVSGHSDEEIVFLLTALSDELEHARERLMANG